MLAMLILIKWSSYINNLCDGKRNSDDDRDNCININVNKKALVIAISVEMAMPT